MTAQARDINSPVPAPRAPRRTNARMIRLSQRDIDGLMLCGEHYGVPLDLVAVALGTEPKRTSKIEYRWRRDGYVATGQLGPGPRWCWLTRDGMTITALRYPAVRPAAGRHGHIPDAEIAWPSIIGSPCAGQVRAIEVELSLKPIDRIISIMTELLTPMRYAQVVYLTAPAARSVVSRAVSSLPPGDQARMAVRDLPETAFTPGRLRRQGLGGRLGQPATRREHRSARNARQAPSFSGRISRSPARPAASANARPTVAGSSDGLHLTILKGWPLPLRQVIQAAGEEYGVIALDPVPL